MRVGRFASQQSEQLRYDKGNPKCEQNERHALACWARFGNCLVPAGLDIGRIGHRILESQAFATILLRLLLFSKERR